ncbi:cytochrome c5 family protein [Seongchinamella sediminis]|uniref:Cytochrome c5 family protein n=1 Tax=Seongchinamella sediminis TaxID=2283635 RepID=A0A3L7E357_9GAMM|nr:c-type cytochrome [Seongchinamella sediminis]RLQ22811.1 cytochrome c5 family protein [Seongchinamella sediminis]
MKFALPACLAAALLLTACGEPGGNSPAAEAASRALRPADPALAEIYDRSCRSCHTVAATGSPLTGDRVAWEPRLAKGMNTLLDNVVNGFGGMPPFGLCMDCDAEQFAALITFMAAGE